MKKMYTPNMLIVIGVVVVALAVFAIYEIQSAPTEAGVNIASIVVAVISFAGVYIAMFGRSRRGGDDGNG